MCFVSVVSDFYGKQLGPFTAPTTSPAVPVQWVQNPATTSVTIATMNVPPENIEELRKLIAEFKEMMAMAKRMDIVMKQPDCVDPEKAKLQERVLELEKRLTDIAAAAAG